MRVRTNTPSGAEVRTWTRTKLNTPRRVAVCGIVPSRGRRGAPERAGRIEEPHVDARRPSRNAHVYLDDLAHRCVRGRDDRDVDARERCDGPHDADDEQREREHANGHDRFLPGGCTRRDAVGPEGEQHDGRESEVAGALVSRGARTKKRAGTHRGSGG